MSNKIYQLIPLLALCFPWLGPHIDSYIPLGYLIVQYGFFGADLGFYVMFSVLFLIYSLVSWLLLMIVKRVWDSIKHTG